MFIEGECRKHATCQNYLPKTNGTETSPIGRFAVTSWRRITLRDNQTNIRRANVHIRKELTKSEHYDRSFENVGSTARLSHENTLVDIWTLLTQVVGIIVARIPPFWLAKSVTEWTWSAGFVVRYSSRESRTHLRTQLQNVDKHQDSQLTDGLSALVIYKHIAYGGQLYSGFEEARTTF